MVLILESFWVILVVRGRSFFTLFLFSFFSYLIFHGSLFATDYVVGKKSCNYETRFRIIHGYHSYLPKDKISPLLNFLLETNPQEIASKEELVALRNDVADKLLNQRQIDLELAPAFFKILKDNTYWYVWRNYILQKLDHLHRVDTRSQVREQIISELEAAAISHEITISGTALLTLDRLVNDGIYTKDNFLKLAEHTLAEEHIKWQDKITILHLSAKYGSSKAIKSARLYLQSSNPTLLKVASIAVIGNYGKATDQQLLTNFRDHPDYRLRRASKVALKKL